MKALLAVAMLVLQVNPASTGAASGESVRFLFAWRGVPVGTVSLALEAGRFTYTSRHLHMRGGHAGERIREVTLDVDAAGRVVGADAVPQALWLWRGPPPEGCVKGREELSAQEGPHCVTARTPTSAEGTMLGARFRASYDARGRLRALEVGESRFTVAAPGERLRSPPELFADGVPVEGGATGALKLVPGGQGRPPAPVPERLPDMTEWTPDAARALSRRVHAAFTDKGPTAADWRAGGEGEAGGCLAHALRFGALARSSGQRVGLVHGLLVVDGGPARPHAWVRVALRGGGVLDLDPTSLEAVRADTHLALALVSPEGPGLEAGERWLSLLRGEWRVVRATRRE
ncbi:transglutaminase domain-containing protein [Corallococcus sp. ZKHCc1 1396]|uniref:Transglutaminase domain-containing protein n=3 Tax=Corallococcus soli TaxID=2710757 RepID=A0ABR9PRU0_9BACT|nr:lasso peptide biosynthesis protein [Corallococcus soli]MBE4750645.1 transglutaminase domain-containing protein [Corallococcus soli]